MVQKIVLLLSVFMTFSTSAVFAYSSYGTNKDNSKAAKYYRGEISTDEYVDYLGVPRNTMQNHGTVRGELRRSDFGDGYTYKDSTGQHTEYRKRSSGGYDVYSNQ